MDPFVFLLQSVDCPVRVHTVNRETTSGTLLAVDDHCNIMLKDWSTTGHLPSIEGAAPASLRFIRGEQIRTITLAPQSYQVN
nr:Lsm3p [Trypanosoma brucei]